MRYPLIVGFTLLIGCASGDDGTADYTIGEGTTSANGGRVQSGGTTEPVYPNCTGDVYCYANEVCDEASGMCVPSRQNDLPNPDTPERNNEDESSAMADASVGASSTGGCDNATDIAVFQSALICNDGCDETFEREEAQCQQTPSRIADCLASATDRRNTCLSMCADVGGSITSCMTTCNEPSNANECGVICMRSEFGFSAACEACIGAVFECGANFCRSLCLDAINAECDNCLQTNCAVEFTQCAGIMYP